jgi:hypothetical protein
VARGIIELMFYFVKGKIKAVAETSEVYKTSEVCAVRAPWLDAGAIMDSAFSSYSPEMWDEMSRK